MGQFRGLYTALITAFDADGKINAPAIQRVIENNLAKGVDGFYVSGSTGESYMLSVDERKYLLEAAREAIPQDKGLIVNIGMFATEHSLELARHAEKTGVSAISSVPPFYFSFNKEEYRAYYNDLAEGTGLPVIVYNIPAMSAVTFTGDDLNGFLKNDKIAGVKFTSYDLYQLQRLINMNPAKSIFIGHDELFLSALAVGVQAGIGSTYNIMAEKFVRIMDFYNKKELDRALEIQNEVNEVVDVLIKVGVFKGVKEILRLQGLDCGDCRRPFLPLKDEEKKLLIGAAEKNGLI